MSDQVPGVKEVMALAKQLQPEDRARLLWRVALTLENYLNTELMERETPVSEMCGGLDSATPWDKASVIWWLAQALEADLKGKQSQAEKSKKVFSPKRHSELPSLEQDISEIRREAWANFPREGLYQ